MNNAARDGIELMLVVGVGATLWSAVSRLRRGQIRVFKCRACGRPTSRAYPRCRHCDAELS